LKRHFATFVKIAVPIAILGWLLTREWGAIQGLWYRPKDPFLLFASFAFLTTATCLSFTRWFLLVRALNIPFRLRDAFRLGFMGYLFNFVGPGGNGGDLFKAWFVAREQQTRRPEAIATILLDRAVGLYALLVVATISIFVVDTAGLSELRKFLQLVTWITYFATALIVLLLMPAKYTDWLLNPLARLPFVGPIFTRVRAALELYRRRRIWLVAIGGISITIHILVGLSMHCADRAVHPVTPSIQEHLIISPLATTASAAPVPGGLGTYEFAMDYLYDKLPKQRFVAGSKLPTIGKGQGLAVAIIYRLMTILIAVVAVFYYLMYRNMLADGPKVGQRAPAAKDQAPATISEEFQKM